MAEAPEPEGGPEVLLPGGLKEELQKPTGELCLMPTGLPEDMMTRFEALSRAFKAEVEGLVDHEKATSKESNDQLQARIKDMEEHQKGELKEAQVIAVKLREFVGRRQAACLEHVFGCAEPPAEPQVSSVADLGVVVSAFIQANDCEQSPELQAALTKINELEKCLQEQNEKMGAMEADLREARVLKSQEERDLIEFRSLREKDSEIQDCNLRIAQTESQLEELKSAHKVLSTRALQSEASMGEKSRKMVDLVRKLEEQTEQSRILSNENNTLRLLLGKDSDYIKVMDAPEDPLSYRSSGGETSEELQREEQRFRGELVMVQNKFPGLENGSENYRSWCGVQLSRQCSIYRSFIHLFQDLREDFPAEAAIEFVSKTKEVDAAWSQREEEMKDQDAAFQEREKIFTKCFEENRLNLVAERDGKIKQLLEQTERSQSKAEKQLLMQQAKLYGQRMDAQIERLWDEQRKERDARWAEHCKSKNESRQRFKDESLSVQDQVDNSTTASSRFQDAAQARLASVEDAWHRNLEKDVTINTSVLRGGDLAECLKATGVSSGSSKLPCEGALHSGVSEVVESIEHVVKHRAATRGRLRAELESQTFQQLRSCVQTFLQKEGAQSRKNGAGSEEEKTPDYAQAATIKCLLQTRQHRVVADTIRRQFYDFLLVLRIATLGAARLLPANSARKFMDARDARMDLPPLPTELAQQTAEVSHNAKIAGAEAGAGCQEINSDSCDGLERQAQQCEERFLYDSVMRRLLEQALTSMHSEHREELLNLKRAHAKEVRSALQHLCQLEASAVDRAIKFDLDEYTAQVRSKLVSDCEYQIGEERRQLNEQVEENLGLHVSAYQREAADEERAALRERRKWLTERLVVMQSQGAINPGDRAVMEHLRSELRACELRFEMREQELHPGGEDMGAVAKFPKQVDAKVTGSNSVRTDNVLGPDTGCFRGSVESAAPMPTQASAASVQISHANHPAPVPPQGAPPQSRRPSSRGVSPSPTPRDHQETTLPIGRVSGSPREPTVLHFPSPPSTCSSMYRDLMGNASPPDEKLLSGCSPVFGALHSPRERLPLSIAHERSPSFGADGAAGFGKMELLGGADPLLAPVSDKSQSKPSLYYTPKTQHAPPLYEWPFEGDEKYYEVSEQVPFANASDLKGSQRGLVASPSRGGGLPPLKQPAFNGAGGPGAGTSRRGMPPLLPPVGSPRGYA